MQIMLIKSNLTGYIANTYTELYAFIQGSLYTLSISIMCVYVGLYKIYLHGYSIGVKSLVL
jgi:hypothetical protein